MDSSTIVYFPSIDTPTLAVARAIIQLTLAGLIIWTGSRQEQRSGTHWWAFGLALHGFALLVFTIHYAPIESLLVAVNHLSFGFSSACILMGFWQFGQRQVQRWLLLIIVCIPAISLLLWEWWLPNARLRILTTASGQVIYLVALLAVLARAPRSEMDGIYRSLRWIVGSYALLMVWSYGSLGELLPTTARVPPGYHSVLFSVWSMLFMLSLAVSFLALQYSYLACRHADQARRDWLTGLLNRRGLLEAVEQRGIEQDNSKQWAVLAIDVDRFKAINDRFGHTAGDRVLKTLAEELDRHAGPGDLVARMGGEEFLFLTVGTDGEKAGALAEKLRLAFAELVIEPSSESLQITVSIGVAARRHGETLDDIVHRADDALYQAKREGRNQVAMASAAMGSE